MVRSCRLRMYACICMRVHVPSRADWMARSCRLWYVCMHACTTEYACVYVPSIDGAGGKQGDVRSRSLEGMGVAGGRVGAVQPLPPRVRVRVIGEGEGEGEDEGKGEGEDAR